MALKKLTSTESIIIGFVVGILCPLLLFVLFWWVSASLSIYGLLAIPESSIAMVAVVGLVVGIVLDVIYLRKWIPQFYRVNLKVMALVYLGCSAIAVASFMGLPAGNLVLGTLAGIYIGRREYHAGSRRESALKIVRKASFFPAIVIGVESLAIGLLALNEDWVVEWLAAATRMDSGAIESWFGIGLILVLCAIMMAVQFWCTSTMARIAFGLGREEGF